MDVPSYTTFILSLMTKIDIATQSFIATGYANLSNYLQVPVAMACTLLFILMGYGILHGFIEMSIKTFSKVILTVGGVYTLGFSWSHFNTYVIELFLSSANEIAGVMVQGKLFDFPFLPGTGTGLNAALQTVLIESVKVGGWVMAKGGFTDWLPYFIGLSFMIGGTIVVALAAVEIIVVKLYIAMLLAVAPFFIACLLFPQTKGQFDGWLAQLKGFSIALILLGVAIGLCMYLMHWVVGGYFIQKAIHIKIYSLVPLLFASILCVLILTGIIPIAKQIGGSHGSSGWAAVGGAMGAMAGSMMSSAIKGSKLSTGGVKALSTLSSGIGTVAGQSMLNQSKSVFSHIRSLSQGGHRT